ncbi:PaaI family thioesterase [Phenylobacterium sp.]|jgi:uncharacterized protein (TIGR00369 family)|uniref:PaaI family thioesterase n=1 Tax=Phenylobacterium sp. TaxID=1871053 RepID=UPI002F9268DF
MSADQDTLRQMAEMMAIGAPQAAALGFRLVSVEPSKGAIMVPWREDLAGDPDTGVIAGGVVTTLLDHVCGLSIMSRHGARTSTATLDLRIDYMRAAKPRAGVTAEAHCYKVTRTIAFVRAQAWDEDPADPIATAQAAFVLQGAPA